MNTGKLTLDDWQKELLAYTGHLLLCTGRQVGKTTIMAIKAALYMINNPNSQIIVVSLTEDQAKLMILMVLDYLEKNHKKEIKQGKERPTQNKINLINKSSIIARPVGNTGDAVRGFTGDILIIDEASKMPELVFDAAKPTLLTTGGKIWMCSTPFGKKGYFYESWVNKHNRFKVFHISSEEVIYNRPINDIWTKEKREENIKFLEEEKADMSDLAYGQEYLGKFMDDMMRQYDEDWINKVCILKRPDIMPKEDNYMGCDIARMGGDLTTYEILNARDGKIIKQIEHIKEQYMLTTHTTRRIIHTTQLFNCSKVGIDAGAGSLGVGIYDFLLEHQETKSKVVAMNNRTISLDRFGEKTQRIMNEDYHELLKAAGERGEVLLLDDEDIKLSFRSIIRDVIKRDDQVSSIKIHGSDSHIVEGIKRAFYLAKKEKSKNFFIYGF